MASTTDTPSTFNSNYIINITTNETRNSFSYSFIDDFYLATSITCSIEAFLTIFSNFILFLVIVSSSSLRRQMRNKMILSLVIDNLTVGIFSSSFEVDFAVRRDWIHGCYFHVITSLLTIYVQNFVCLWGIVSLLLHYIARLQHYDGPPWLPSLPASLQRAVPLLIVAMPWLASLILITPLVFVGLLNKVQKLWDTAFCPLILEAWTSRLLVVLVFFLPAVFIIVLILVVIKLYRKNVTGIAEAQNRTEMATNLVDNDEDRLESPLMHVLVAIMTLLLLAPEHIFFGGEFHSSSPIKAAIFATVVTISLSELLPFVLAVIWLCLLPGIRRRVAEIAQALPNFYYMHCRARRPSQNSCAGSVAFRNLQDE